MPLPSRTALCIFLLLCLPVKLRGDEPTAVRLVHNAVIYTVDPAQPKASAMAWGQDGRVLAVGSDDRVRGAYPAADARDLEGRTVVPGLIDAHAHLYGLALSLTRAELMGTTSKQDIIDRLRAHEKSLAPGDWLLGGGWDQNDWVDPALPTRHDLDRAFPERPVWLRRVDGHAGWANSAALALTDRDLGGNWQPEAGFIHRDAQGQATGVLIDGAMGLVEPLVPATSRAVQAAALERAIAAMARAGLTGVHDAGIDQGIAQLYLQLIEQQRFHTRVYALAEGSAHTVEWLCRRGPIEHASGRLVMRSVKLYEDGALGSRGAALLEDYADEAGNRGLLFHEPEELARRISTVLSCGLQVGVHAIGDRANRVALDALENVIPQFTENPGRHRIEHAQVLAADDVPRFAALGVIAAMQPTHATSDMYWADERLGEERLRYSYAWRSLLDSGARLALGSDFPVERVNPMLGLYAAVTRQDTSGWPEDGWWPKERLSRAEALRGFTLDAAWAGFMEDEVGSLEPGKYADFIVLDRDIMSVPVDQIPGAVVLETWLDGERVFLHPEARWPNTQARNGAL
jgi:predicted amidohydrolase YtcJ